MKSVARFGFAIAATTGMLLVGAMLYSQETTPSTAVPGDEPSPLLEEPQTPEETFEAMLLMVDIARLDVAQRYLEQFLATDPSDELMLQLRDEYGTGAFIRLSNIKALQPRSVALLDRMIAAAKRQATDETYISKLLDQLREATADRETAVRDLRNVGVPAVPVILRRLAAVDPGDQVAKDTLIYALARMGRQTVPPLVGGLSSPIAEVRGGVIEALTAIGAREAAPYLWHLAYAPDEPTGVRVAAMEGLAELFYGSERKTDLVTERSALEELFGTAEAYFRQAVAPRTANPEPVEVWTWDDQIGTVGSRTLAPHRANLYLAETFARWAFELAPTRSDVQRLYAAAALAGYDEQTVSSNGRLADNFALTLGAGTLNDVLSYAMEARSSTAAVEALRGLGQVATTNDLRGPSREHSPIIAALNYPDRKVQFAAASTVMLIDPKLPVPQLQRVVPIFARAVQGGEVPLAVVVDANTVRAGSTVSFLSELGFDADVVQTGRSGFQAAVENSHVELIVLHANTLEWELRDTVANLRADARTAFIPIVIYGDERLREKMVRLAERHPLMTFAAHSSTAANFELQLADSLAAWRNKTLSPVEVDRMRNEAIYWLARIAENGRTDLYDLTRAEAALFEAAQDENVARNALVALGSIESSTVQSRLYELAVPEARPELIRRLAAVQLAYHIQRFGLTLTVTELEGLRPAYLRAETPALKSALAGVLGSLKPNTELVSERLRAFPPPTLPAD